MTVITGIPLMYTEAKSSRDSRKWQEAMNEEMLSLEENHVWKLVKLPSGCKATDNRWVYCVKQLSDGSDDRYKAHLVAKGYSQRSLYGLKQSPRCWNKRFVDFMLKLGFAVSDADPSLYRVCLLYTSPSPRDS